MPNWEVRKIYHWRQVFAAHKVLRVRHEYSPAFGFEEAAAQNFRSDYTGDPHSGDIGLVKDGCISPSIQKAGMAATSQEGHYVSAMWVDFVLTTANNWQTPIKDFELIIDRGPRKHDWYSEDWNEVSVCLGGAVKRINADRYEASAKDFIPQRELRVVFLTMPKEEEAPVASVVLDRRSQVGGRGGWVVGSLAGVAVLGAVGLIWQRNRRVPRG